MAELACWDWRAEVTVNECLNGKTNSRETKKGEYTMKKRMVKKTEREETEGELLNPNHDRAPHRPPESAFGRFPARQPPVRLPRKLYHIVARERYGVLEVDPAQSDVLVKSGGGAGGLREFESDGE